MRCTRTSKAVQVFVCVATCLAAWALAPSPASAESIIYATGFSADPAWITDQPSNFRWDSGSGT